MIRHFRTIPLLCAALAAAVSSDYQSAKQKFDRIEADRERAGSRIELSAQELSAYAAGEAPDGVREPKIQLLSPGMVTGTAQIDFLKLRRAQGSEPGWLTSKLLNGEHPVKVTAHISSGGGRTTVDLQSVEISGIKVDGRTLDFLIQHVLLRLYPDAVVGQPFEMGHHIEKLDVQQRAVAVVIGK